MDIVSFETAMRLKEAGFPQPEFATGQMWYNQYRAVSIIGKMEIMEDGSGIAFFCTSLHSGRTACIVPVKANAYYAPSATDIFRCLPVDTLVSREQNDLFAVLRDDYRDLACDLNNSLVEALAYRWLQIKASEK